MNSLFFFELLWLDILIRGRSSKKTIQKPAEFSCNVLILKWEGSELTWITYEPSISP